MSTRRGPGNPNGVAPVEREGSGEPRGGAPVKPGAFARADTGRPAGDWRPRSVPEQLGVAGLGAAGAAAAYQATLGGEGIFLPCPLRALTGIPCPLCGMTTAATGLASGDLGAALAANPFVLLLAGFTLVMAVLMTARAIGRAPAAAQWPASRRRQSYWVVGLLAAASWAFQLHRFGWV
jgi:Protein of unknown function (DUF2752)